MLARIPWGSKQLPELKQYRYFSLHGSPCIDSQRGTAYGDPIRNSIYIDAG